MSLIHLESIKKSINEHIILDNIKLDLDINEFVCLVGKSGCGKTSLLNVLGMIDDEYEGSYTFNNKKIKKRDLNKNRASYFSFVFQDYGFVPYLNAKENINTFLTGQNRDLYIKLLENFNLQNKENLTVKELSGGEKQRFALIKSSLKNSKIIIADEPTGSLDSENSIKVMEFLKQNNDGKLIIMATHNLELAKKYATRIIVIDEGKIVDDQKIQDIDHVSKIERITNNFRNKTKNQIRSSLNFIKTNIKKVFPITLLMSLCFSFIILLFGAKSGFTNIIDTVATKNLDSRYVEINENNAGISCDEYLKQYQIEYTEDFNTSFIFNNFVKRHITKQNFINFDYSISVVDFKLSSYVPNSSHIAVNSLFSNLYKKETINLSLNEKLLDIYISFNEEENIENIIKETSLYNLPKIYLDKEYANSLIGKENIEYLKTQEIINIPRSIFVMSPLNLFYEAINKENVFAFKTSNELENKIIVDSSSYIYFGPLYDLINSLSILVIVLIIILIIIIYSSFTILLESFYLKRKREYAINFAFGESPKDIKFRIMLQNLIIIGTSVIFSLLLSIAIKTPLNMKLLDILSINGNIIPVEIETKGLLSVFFTACIIIILSSAKKIKNKEFLEDLKNE